jgi:hypothetical protein
MGVSLDGLSTISKLFRELQLAPQVFYWLVLFKFIPVLFKFYTHGPDVTVFAELWSGRKS